MKKITDKIIDSGNTAVLVVDMQYGSGLFFHKDHWNELIKNQVAILEFCKKNDIPAYLLEMRTYGETVASIWDAFIKVPRAAYLFRKEYGDAFYKTDVRKVLREWNISKVFISGVNASVCVYQTAIGAKKSGLDVITADNVIADSPVDYMFTGEIPNPAPEFERKGILYLWDYQSYFRK